MLPIIFIIQSAILWTRSMVYLFSKFSTKSPVTFSVIPFTITDRTKKNKWR